MPWPKTTLSDQKLLFIAKWLEQDWDMTTLCREFGISRKTGYQVLARYQEHGAAGLTPQSRAPLQPANAVPPAVRQQVLHTRLEHPTWGPRKLRAYLQRAQPTTAWPAASTIGDWLHTAGLSQARPARRTPVAAAQPAATPTPQVPNALWCADFKGWFRTGDGVPCYPLTLSDAHSRYLLRVQALTQTDYSVVQPWFVAAFRTYGLPQAIRTDNGPPFASTGLGGLSRLAVWWIRLGIYPDRIAPGRPDQNGRHERMHRTLKAEATQPAQANVRAQQRVFDRFVREFNEQRPHQALGQVVPASVYCASPRAYPLRLPEVAYAPGVTLRHVRSNGQMRWQGQLVYVSESLVGQVVGLEPLDEAHWQLSFGPLPLAVWSEPRRAWLTERQVRQWRATQHIEETEEQAKVLPMSPV